MPRQCAFSLFELLITLSIMSILLLIAFPLSKIFFDHSREQVLQSQLLHAIQVARDEARVRGVAVVLCKSKDQRRCSGDWINGQIVFMDKNQDGIVHDPSQILMVFQLGSQQGILHWRSFPVFRDYLLFLPSGFPRNDNGTFWYCPASAHLPAWAIVIAKSGRVRIVLPDQHGVIKDDQGKMLSC